MIDTENANHIAERYAVPVGKRCATKDCPSYQANWKVVNGQLIGSAFCDKCTSERIKGIV